MRRTEALVWVIGMQRRRKANLVQPPPSLSVEVVWILALQPPDVVQRELERCALLYGSEIRLCYLAERALFPSSEKGEMWELETARQRDCFDAG